MSSCPSATSTPRASARSTGATEPVCGSLTSPSRTSRASSRTAVCRADLVVAEGAGVTRHGRGPAARGGAWPRRACGWCRSAGSGASSVSMATRRPSRTASAQAHSTCASWSAVVASIHGMPPTTFGAEAMACLDQLGRPGVAQHAVLGEGDDVDVHPAARSSSRGGLHGPAADQPRRGVGVGERLHMQDAVAQAVGQRLADRGQQCLDAVVLLDRAGEVDAPRRVGHAVGRVRLAAPRRRCSGRVRTLSRCRCASTNGSVTRPLSARTTSAPAGGGSSPAGASAVTTPWAQWTSTTRPSRSRAPGAGDDQRRGHPE